MLDAARRLMTDSEYVIANRPQLRAPDRERKTSDRMFV
jgi:hypothetical protein